MSEATLRQITFYANYGGVSNAPCPLMTGLGFKKEASSCDCEPLRGPFANLCDVDGKCPVREYYFRSNKMKTKRGLLSQTS